MKHILMCMLIGGIFLILSSGCTQYNPSGWEDNGTVIKTVNNNEVLILGNFTLDDTVFEDLRFPITALKIGPAKPPAFNINEWTYDFDDSDAEQVYIIAQMPHARKRNTWIDAHFHWQSISGDTGDVVWCLEYTWSNISFSFPTNIFECVVDTGTADTTLHLLTTHIEISGSDKSASSILKARVFRNGTDDRDTYTGDAGLLEFDMHYEINKLGTDEHLTGG